MSWEEYFDNLATSEIEDHKKVGWGSRASMYSKFYTALKLLPLWNGQRLLDIGCGIGAFEELLRIKYPSLEIHPMDISSEQLAIAKQKSPSLDFTIGSVMDIPYPEAFFDCVVCIGVLQNFDGSLDVAISEMVRVLKNGSHIFVVAMDADYIGFKSGERIPHPIHKYLVPEKLSELYKKVGCPILKMGAISSESIGGVIVPLHQQHTFFIWGRKR